MPTAQGICDAMRRDKIARGEVKPRKTQPKSSAMSIFWLVAPLLFAAPMFRDLWATTLAERPGALLPLSIFGGLAAMALTVLAVGAFRPKAALLNNWLIRGIAPPAGVAVLLVLAVGGAIRTLPTVLTWLFLQ